MSDIDPPSAQEPPPRSTVPTREKREALELALHDACLRALPLFSYKNVRRLFDRAFSLAAIAYMEDHELDWEQMEGICGLARKNIQAKANTLRPSEDGTQTSRELRYEGGAYRWVLGHIQDAGRAGIAVGKLHGHYEQHYVSPVLDRATQRFERLLEGASPKRAAELTEEHEKDQRMLLRRLEFARVIRRLEDGGDIVQSRGVFRADLLGVEHYKRAVKRLILLLRGETWRERAWIAHRYTPSGMCTDDLPSMDLVLGRLVDEGVVEQKHHAYRTLVRHVDISRAGGLSPDLAADIERQVATIARLAMAPDSNPNAGLFSMTVQLPDTGDATVRELGQRVLAAVHAELDKSTEVASDLETMATVVLAVGPGVA